MIRYAELLHVASCSVQASSRSASLSSLRTVVRNLALYKASSFASGRDRKKLVGMAVEFAQD
eukprot:3808587-Prymnesium_polylepis.1